MKASDGKRKWLRIRRITYNGELYMTRIYLFAGWMLNWFHKPDPGRHLHNHPWDKASSLHLFGSYVEEFIDGSMVIRKWGQYRTFRGELYHRITAVSPFCVTLFRSGKTVGDWGFWTEDGYISHKRYLPKDEQ